MARHGENIRKRKSDGRWEARYPRFHAGKGKKVYCSVYGNTYEEAKAKRDAAIRGAVPQSYTSAEHRTADDMSCMRITFAQAAEEWLGEVEEKRRHSTYVKYASVYRKHLEEATVQFLLSSQPDQELQKKISDHLSEKKLSGSLRRSALCVVSQILEYAAGKYSTYVPLLKLAAAKPIKKPIETFSKAEQSRLFAYIYADMDRFRLAVLLCLYTGMRLGELCALRWTDIDFREMTVTVSRTVQRIAVKGQAGRTTLMETEPKSESSKRTIPLTGEVITLLKSSRGNCPYVFGIDKPLEPRTMQYRFKKILKETEIPDRKFHILRHTFATNCVESSMDVKTLSMILGHSDVKITLNRYVHPTMESRRKQIGLLPDFYGQIHGQTT